MIHAGKEEEQPGEDHGPAEKDLRASTSESMPDETTPDLIYQLAVGFMASKSLFIASKVGLFECLAEGPATLDEVTRGTGLPRRTAAILLDAMVAVGLVQRMGNGFKNGPVAERYLGRNPLVDLRPFLKFWDELSYPGWSNFEQAVRRGPQASHESKLNAAEEQVFVTGIESFTAGTADSLAASYDFARHKRILDLGGGTGVFLKALLLRYPHLECTLFDLPNAAAATRKRIAATRFGESIQIVDGNFFSDPLPEGHDLVLLCNILDLFSSTSIAELLGRIRATVQVGTRLLIADILWTTATHTSPIFTTLMAGEYLLLSRANYIYCVEELVEWLQQTGWMFVGQQELVGPTNLVVAEAR